MELTTRGLGNVYKYWTVQNLLYECCFGILTMSYSVLHVFFTFPFEVSLY